MFLIDMFGSTLAVDSGVDTVSIGSFPLPVPVLKGALLRGFL